MDALLVVPAGRAATDSTVRRSRRIALLLAVALAAAMMGATVANAPAASAAPPTLTAFALGWDHSCALTSTGGVKCWGANQVGQLGDGTTSDRATPVDVVGLTSGVVAISAGGNRTCALTSGGGVKCWGGNRTGAIGDGTTTDRLTPTDVVGITSGATAIAAGAFHTCAVVAGGVVKCWGGNDFGELGDGTLNESVTPVTVAGLSGATAVTAGGRQTCALVAGGVKCWGHNAFGQLGDGSGFSQTTPVDVSGLTSGVVAISAGGRHTCAVTSAGGAKCWGRNDFGQVGDGTLTDRITPVDVLGLTSGVLRLAAGRWHTCSIRSGGDVWCWGPLNGVGDVGDDKQPNPQPVPGLASGAVALAVGEGHACVAMSGGGARCFGNNGSGKLGDGTKTTSLTPVDVLFEGTPTVVSTSTSLTSFPNPSTVGQAVTFTATVTPASGSAVPTGTVSFDAGTTSLGSGVLSGGTATFTTSSLPAGTHTVIASYPGDASLNGSTSPAVTQTVTMASAVATSTSLSASPNPSTGGQTVTFTATVTPASGSAAATGVVNFMEGSATLGTGSLSGGSATFSTASLPVGTHTVTARYTGGAGFIGSASPAVTQTVNAPATRAASINDVSVTEPDDGFVVATFTITLSRAAGRGKVTMMLNTADGTATAPKDYTAKVGTTVSFAYGQSVKTVAVTVKGDLRTEPNETFTVNLSSPTNATVSDGQGVGTILNDD